MSLATCSNVLAHATRVVHNTCAFCEILCKFCRELYHAHHVNIGSAESDTDGYCDRNESALALLSFLNSSVEELLFHFRYRNKGQNLKRGVLDTAKSDSNDCVDFRKSRHEENSRDSALLAEDTTAKEKEVTKCGELLFRDQNHREELHMTTCSRQQFLELYQHADGRYDLVNITAVC